MLQGAFVAALADLLWCRHPACRLKLYGRQARRPHHKPQATNWWSKPFPCVAGHIRCGTGILPAEQHGRCVRSCRTLATDDKRAQAQVPPGLMDQFAAIKRSLMLTAGRKACCAAGRIRCGIGRSLVVQASCLLVRIMWTAGETPAPKTTSHEPQIGGPSRSLVLQGVSLLVQASCLLVRIIWTAGETPAPQTTSHKPVVQGGAPRGVCQRKP